MSKRLSLTSLAWAAAAVVVAGCDAAPSSGLDAADGSAPPASTEVLATDVTSDRPAADQRNDELQIVALRALFEEDIAGDVPSPREYFAVGLLGRSAPSPAVLERLAAAGREVVPYETGLAREPDLGSPSHQASGLFFLVDAVESVEQGVHLVTVQVGNGWGSALYQLELREGADGWRCVEVRRIAIS